MFVFWVGEKAGAGPTLGWDAYTITYAKWFEKNGHWGTQAKPGAVVYFSWDDKSIDSIDHMSLVKKDNGDAGRVFIHHIRMRQAGPRSTSTSAMARVRQ